MMVATETLSQWVDMLNRDKDRFATRKSPDLAKNMLVTCACIEAALTGYLIKHRLEDAHDHGSK